MKNREHRKKLEKFATHIFLKLFCLYSGILHNDLIRAKTRKATIPALSAANVWSELPMPIKIRSRTKGKEEFWPAPSSQEPSPGACLCWEGNTRCQLPHQPRGEWSWRCQPAAPHSFLPPLPASVWAAPGRGTRVMSPARWGPLEPTAGATNSAQHSQLGTWGHEEPSQPSWAVPGNTTETLQRFQVLQEDGETSIPWERKVFHVLTYSLGKAGHLVNCTEFTAFTSLDRQATKAATETLLPPLFN